MGQRHRPRPGRSASRYGRRPASRRG
jgi:hypothetical protein